jgi:hypothetical protein
MSNNEKIYSPIEKKTFNSVLRNFFLKNLPQFGDAVLSYLVKDLIELIEIYYPPITHLKMGQLLWFAVAADETPGRHKSMNDTRVVPVVLTLVDPDDIKDLKNNVPRHIVSQNVVARIYRQALEQGGVLTEAEVALFRNLTHHAIGKQTLAYEKSHNTVLPRRGTVHDLGPSVTHKKIICQKYIVDKKPISEIASETFHSTSSINRYLNDFNRVLLCLQKGLKIDEISYAANISKNVVNEYYDLIKGIDYDLPI